MKKQKNKFSLKNQYKKSWNYLKKCKNFIWAIVGIFVVFMLIGIFVPAPDFLVEKIMEFIREILAKTEGMSQFEMISFIFLNNLQSSFSGLIFGFIFGIVPVIGAVANGYVLGFVAKVSISEAGILSLWRIFPHGIFELPAVFISLGLGLKFSSFIFQKKKYKSFKEFLSEGLRVFVFIVLPLLIIAGIIEGTLIVLLS